MMPDAALEAVTKVYPNGVRALDGLTLHLADGELLVLLGPSGCGKTTTLRLLAGLEQPTSGIILLDGRCVNGVPPHRRNVGMAFQRPALYPHLTVRQNLQFGLDLRHSVFRSRSREEVESVEQTAALLHLSDVMERTPAQLSGGQQQRAALGRALVRQPGLLLLDEPFSNLDLRLRCEMRRELHLLRRRLRATMCYVTHDQEEALSLGDRVAVLDRGALQQVGPPPELYERPANRFVAAFLGSPPLVTLDGVLIERDGRLCFEGPFGAWPIPAERRADWAAFVGRRVTLGIRPEHVRLGSDCGAASVAVEVRVVERLGASDLVTLGRDAWELTLRREPAAVAPGSAVVVELPLGRAHLFDAADGRALSHARPQG
jgi:multiple sugar transport system ATP-binding protein